MRIEVLLCENCKKYIHGAYKDRFDAGEVGECPHCHHSNIKWRGVEVNYVDPDLKDGQISAKELLERLTANQKIVSEHGTGPGDGGYGKKEGGFLRVCSKLEERAKKGVFDFSWDRRFDFSFWESEIEDLYSFL